MATKTITPSNIVKVTWDVLISLVYLMCFFIDPFCIAFEYEPLFNRNFQKFTRGLTLALIFNMMLVPFSA